MSCLPPTRFVFPQRSNFVWVPRGPLHPPRSALFSEPETRYKSATNRLKLNADLCQAIAWNTQEPAGWDRGERGRQAVMKTGTLFYVTQEVPVNIKCVEDLSWCSMHLQWGPEVFDTHITYNNSVRSSTLFFHHGHNSAVNYGYCIYYKNNYKLLCLIHQKERPYWGAIVRYCMFEWPQLLCLQLQRWNV